MSFDEKQKTSLEQAITLANEAMDVASRCMWEAAALPTEREVALAAYLGEVFLQNHGRMQYLTACLQQRAQRG